MSAVNLEQKLREPTAAEVASNSACEREPPDDRAERSLQDARDDASELLSGAVWQIVVDELPDWTAAAIDGAVRARDELARGIVVGQVMGLMREMIREWKNYASRRDSEINNQSRAVATDKYLKQVLSEVLNRFMPERGNATPQ